jgi:hypothetical protein
MDAENHKQGMPECDRGEAGKQFGMLGFIPVSGELVWGANNDRISFEC